MNGDATEAALGLLGLGLDTHYVLPLKRKQSSSSSFPSSVPPPNDTIDCICGFAYDDGFSIGCDNCSRWCHAACFDIVDGDVPEEWSCWLCAPRPVDRDRAVRLQKARQRHAQHPPLHPHQRIRSGPAVDRKPRRINTAAAATAIDSTAASPSAHFSASTAVQATTTTTTAKRKRRASVSASTPSTSTILFASAEDEQIDIDDPWAQSYVHINHDIVPHPDTRDKLRRQAQHWRGVTALKTPVDTTPPTTPIRLPDNTLPVRTSVHPIPNSSFSHPTLSLNTNPSVRPPSYALHTTSPVPSSQFIAPFRSTITPSATYLSDPLNAYAHLGLPKPFVHLFGPPLDLTLDARIAGGKSRFVRNGCRPNAVLRPLVCNDQEPSALTFGVFALRDLKANEEIVLGWEWDDGHAVHSLPALIETPHMFPPRQITHLRHQMANILHALGSTFTTCACGARAKDCALTQMAAFVDGETVSGEKVDLGPLVGAERGFLTRERVPLSGGMSGVEMVNTASEAEQDTRADLPVLTVSPATASPSPKKDSGWKGKERATVDMGISESESSSHDDRRISSSRSRSRKRRGKRRVTIDSSPRPSSHPASPQSAMQPSEDEGQQQQSSSAVESDESHVMPPKMRKRWNRQSADAGKDLGSLGRGMVFESSSSEVRENDRMDVDDGVPGSATSHLLTPPTTGSELPRFFNTPQSPLAVSPSTSFAKLSLRSPIVDDVNGANDSQSMNVDGQMEGVEGSLKGSYATPQRNTAPLPSSPLVEAFFRFPNSTPASLAALLNDHLPVLPTSGPPPNTSSSSADAHDSVSTADVETAPSPPPLSPQDPPPRSPTPRQPTPPPPPPPRPKVKMSLKDFAMRKKKQREEEEMAKLASPVSTSESLADVSAVTTTTDASATAAEMLPSSDLDGGRAPAGSTEPFASEVSAGGEVVQTDRRSSPGQQDSLERRPSLVPSSLPVVHSQPNGTHSTPIPPHSTSEPHTETLEAKQEYVEVMLPRGLVGPEDRQSAGMRSDDARYLNPPLNGDTRKDTRAYSSSGSSVPLFRHGRRPSREDGEISNGAPPNRRPPPLQPPRSPQNTYSFVPRSHSPPTQPRSFQASVASSSSSATPPVSASPSGMPSRTTPPPSTTMMMNSQGRGTSSSHTHASPPASGTGPPSYRHRSQSQSQAHSYSYSQQQQQGTQLAPGPGQAQASGIAASSRPLPRGPRALQNSSMNMNAGGRGYGGPGAQTLQTPGPFIPRGPSADRDRMEWERDRGWSSRPRGRGGGGGSSGAGGPAGWGR